MGRAARRKARRQAMFRASDRRPLATVTPLTEMPDLASWLEDCDTWGCSTAFLPDGVEPMPCDRCGQPATEFGQVEGYRFARCDLHDVWG